VIPAEELMAPAEAKGTKIIQDYYMISLKDKSCGLEYGRNKLDFDEGVIAFSAPGQVYTNTKEVKKGEITGFLLYFHSDLLRGSKLAQNIANYSFFDYEVSEALHLSTEEESELVNTILSIRSDYERKPSNSGPSTIIPQLERLLDDCLHFYQRQFKTRSRKNQDVVSQFERELKQYFLEKNTLENGLPQIEYFSEKANLSQNYFSDLIKKETGKTPKDHLNDFVVEQAKNLLTLGSGKVSEIAYKLGFNYPHYFIRLFKSKTGYTPLEYRNLN